MCSISAHTSGCVVCYSHALTTYHNPRAPTLPFSFLDKHKKVLGNYYLELFYKKLRINRKIHKLAMLKLYAPYTGIIVKK